MKIINIALIAGCFVICACRKQSEASNASTEIEVQPKADVIEAIPQVEIPKQKSVNDLLQEAKNIKDMWDICLPFMEDSFDDTNPGTKCVGLWAGKNLTWNMVSVLTDETNYNLVRKNPDKERGKRLCVSGTIIQISEYKNSISNEGLLRNASGKLYNFNNVKSSGNLVGHDFARMCGIVTGTYDYHNSGGGVGHTVDIVGIWDLPENKLTVKTIKK